MFTANSTSFSIVEPDFISVSVRVTLVITSCMVSTLGNVFILVIFSRSISNKESNSNNRYRIIDIILASLAITALCRGLVLGPVQATCFITGEWSLGDSMCQFQAFIEVALRNTFIWYLSLLSLERYTKHVIPHDYLVTFSPLTVNVILPGILLIVVVQLTGPLYGWGKYEYMEDSGLCGAATTSNYGCLYGIYLLVCLILPPLTVILINGTLLAQRICCKRSRTLLTTKRNISSGNSLILNAEKEVLSLVLLMLFSVLLSTPRSVLDAATMCSRGASMAIFPVYFLDSLMHLLLPVVCLGMHPNARTVLWGAFQRNENVPMQIGMQELTL